MNRLNPLEMQLTGTSLIEASAGTGKTFTLTTLFLRLLLERQVSVDQILVVTFTIAATEELRIKIQQRLTLAHRWLRDGLLDQQQVTCEDPLLAELLTRHAGDGTAEILADAVARMDQAAVYTIDAFCLRVLQDRAFDTGMAFHIDFIADDTEIRKLVVRDYWRRAPMEPGGLLADLLVAEFRSPDNLLTQIDPVLKIAEPQIVPSVTVADIEAAYQELLERWQLVVQNWRAEHDLISEIVCRHPSINRVRYNKNSCIKLVEQMAEVGQSNSVPGRLPAKFELFEQAKLDTSIKAGCTPPAHRFFTLCDGFSSLFQRYQVQARVALMTHACDYLRRSVAEYKKVRSLMHFEDLRSNLDSALRGERGDALAAAIQQTWPYAMIDEFQDTDAQQYRLFSQVFSGRDEGGLFLIGDPKQAIYSFRGADIFTYIGARRRADPQQSYTLDVNWRSEARLVSAVNALFEHTPAPFIYSDDIPFQPVSARPGAADKPMMIAAAAPPPLQFQLLNAVEMTQHASGLIKSGDAKTRAARACAVSIAQLLNGGDDGTVSIDDKKVSASDIAVLVRSHKDGQLIRDALRSVGIRAVSLGNNSIFQTDEAAELAIVLRAIHSSSRLSLIRAALVTRLLGYRASDMDHLDSDEHRWDKLLEQFHEFDRIWSRRGVLAAIQLMFSTMTVSANLLGYPDGEQRVTNLMQLGEILQLQSQQLPTQGDLLAWFDTRLGSPGIDDELLLRLESDESLVQIVTVHKSKGLEYPVVYYPFPWSPNNNTRSSVAKYHDSQTLNIVFDLGSEAFSEHVLLQQEEDMAEQLRLLYVALTRARNRCVIYWGAIEGAEKSAMGRLLHLTVGADSQSAKVPAMKDLGHAGIVADLARLADSCVGCIDVALLEADADGEHRQKPPVNKLQQQNFGGRIDRSWVITSYTRMIQGVDAGRPDHDNIPSADAVEVAASALPANDPDSAAIFAVPAGAVTGQLLHDLLEHIDFTQMDLPTLTERVTEKVAQRADAARGVGGWSQEHIPGVVSLLQNTLDTELVPGGGFRLAQVAARDRLNELEFHFSIGQLDIDRLNEVLQSDPAYRQTAAGLPDHSVRASLSGLMRGFIDLVVRHDGRYYIVDYKSNRLGESLESYQTASLKQAIQSHHYDLQYLVYTVALHRYLATRIHDYQYERDFGGIYYLFLRGMRPGLSTGVWYDRPSNALVDALDQAFCGNGVISA